MTKLPNQCPKCKQDGEGFILPPEGQRKHETQMFLCKVCNLEWNINDDFKCLGCGKETGGYFMYCSQECSWLDFEDVLPNASNTAEIGNGQHENESEERAENKRLKRVIASLWHRYVNDDVEGFKKLVKETLGELP